MNARHAALYLVVTLLSACSSRATMVEPGNDDPEIMTPGAECSAGMSRCNRDSYETCASGKFVTRQTCTSGRVCDDALGCVACKPGLLCQGDEVRLCRPDGTIGDKQDTCRPGGCMNGQCVGGSCGAGADLVYVVDQSYNLIRFNPKMGKGGFSVIGRLNCPAGTALPGHENPATPFSMSVDRTGTAWVLYTSGEIFHVNTMDASCKKSAFAIGQQGLDLFGMGFVSDAAGSNKETLFLCGGDAVTAGHEGHLAKVDPAALLVSTIGDVDLDEYGPELTGTGNAELWAYFPGETASKVARLDKSNARNAQEWRLPGLGGTVSAWAFAHWGGQYYIFVTTEGLLNKRSRYLVFDPAKGGIVSQEDIPYVIVGAGVSTCAPVVIG